MTSHHHCHLTNKFTPTSSYFFKHILTSLITIISVCILGCSQEKAAITTPASTVDTNTNAAFIAYERKDYATAIVDLKKLAEQGNAKAQFKVGNMYAKGLGVPKEPRIAIEWLGKAADQGDANAQTNLAIMYSDGVGVIKDDRVAVELFRKSANQGDAIAQAYLGLMYTEGNGTPKDEHTGLEWFLQSANQGNPEAQFYVGLMYQNARGVAKDEMQAYYWWLLSSAQGNETAKKWRDIIEPNLSSTQQQHAQTIARAWKPNQPIPIFVSAPSESNAPINLLMPVSRGEKSRENKSNNDKPSSDTSHNEKPNNNNTKNMIEGSTAAISVR